MIGRGERAPRTGRPQPYELPRSEPQAPSSCDDITRADVRVSPEPTLPEAVERLEKRMVQAALEQSDGRVDEAARRLGISRKGLFLKRRRWGLEKGDTHQLRGINNLRKS